MEGLSPSPPPAVLRCRALFGHGVHMPVVLADALIEVRHLAEQVADDQVGEEVATGWAFSAQFASN